MFIAISHLNLQSREDSEMTASKQKDMFVRYAQNFRKFLYGIEKIFVKKLQSNISLKLKDVIMSIIKWMLL